MENKEEMDNINPETQEELEEIILKEFIEMSPEEALLRYNAAEAQYQGSNFKLQTKEAELRIKTNFDEKLPHIPKITKDDKEAYIFLKTKKLREAVNLDDVARTTCKELLRIKKIQLDKE